MSVKKHLWNAIPYVLIVLFFAAAFMMWRYRTDGFQTQTPEITIGDDICSILSGLKTSLKQKLDTGGTNKPELTQVVENALKGVEEQLKTQKC